MEGSRSWLGKSFWACDRKMALEVHDTHGNSVLNKGLLTTHERFLWNSKRGIAFRHHTALYDEHQLDLVIYMQLRTSLAADK